MQVANTAQRAVIVGCARNCAAFLPAVLHNVNTIASLYSEAAFIFVENDSTDNTRKILQKWLSGRATSLLICPDGLIIREQRRSARLAIARNMYMDALHQHQFVEFDHLVVLDFDGANTDFIPERSLLAAITFLDSAPRNAAVFANQLPYYYDIWALRHDAWCPEDCRVQIENRPIYLPRHRAIERYVTNRQLNIPIDSPPVPVRSAFGGLGIYKLDFVRTARYVGLLSDGSEICEHVAFNEVAVQAGGALYIFPELLNSAPAEHIPPRLSNLSRLAADLDPRSYRFYYKLSSLVRQFKGFLG